MKKIKKVLALFLTLCLVAGFGCGCWSSSPDLPPSITPEPDKFPDFETQYTEEEHVQRIQVRLEEIFYEISYQIKEYHIEIVYSFYDHQPEYFLITVEYQEEYALKTEDYTINYKHIVGRIVNDRYTHGLDDYRGFVWGRSPWDFCGYTKGTKYYGYHIYGIETEEGILQFFNSSTITLDNRWEFMDDLIKCKAEQKILSLQKQKAIKDTATWMWKERYELYQKEN